MVANCVFTLLPMIPCRPIDALANPSATKARAFVHAGSPRLSATPPWPLCQTARAAAMVKSVWSRVPRKSHRRVLAPILSPIRPRKEPPRKERREVRACRSGMRKEKSVWPGLNKRAMARANCVPAVKSASLSNENGHRMHVLEPCCLSESRTR